MRHTVLLMVARACAEQGRIGAEQREEMKCPPNVQLVFLETINLLEIIECNFILP